MARMKLTTQAASSAPDSPDAKGVSPALAAFLRGFRALRIRNYRLFWCGQLISLIGTWMQSTAQSWLVLQLTHSPLALGLVTMLQFLPAMLLSLFGGAIADRLPKYRVVLATQTAALIQAAIFGGLIVSGTIQLWHVYILALALGMINALDTPTRQAFVAELVGREDMANAVALNSLLFNGARIIGPAVAGVLIARIGMAPAFVLNAVSFVGVLAGLLMMRPAEFRAAPARPTLSVGKSIAEALQYTWRTPAVLLVMLVMAFIGTFGYNFNVVLPLISGFVLHTNAEGFGILSASLGVGSLLGALVVAFAGEVNNRRLLGGAALFSLLLGGAALVSNFSLSLLLLAALGFAGIIFTTSANTLIQLAVPDALRGRVMSLYWLLFAGSTPIGSLLIGSLSDHVGVSATLVLCAALCMGGVGLATLYERRMLAR